MILADKIVTLRKKAGWSQEELAQQLNVTRQSVSKWEGAQSIPDMEKILQMSRIFGVTIDFLLKDEMETAEAAPETETTAARRVTMEEASRYLELRRQAAPKMALATLLCVLSPAALLMLSAVSQQTDPLWYFRGDRRGRGLVRTAGSGDGGRVPVSDLRRPQQGVSLFGGSPLRNGIRRNGHGQRTP